MNEIETRLRAELNRLLPVPAADRADWSDVVRRSEAQSGRRPRPISRRRLALAGIGAAAAIAGTTPLGATVARGLDGFADWLRGSPGRPAPPADQAAFEATNGLSWAAFPTDTKLRRLLDTTIGGRRYVLDGFRSGRTLCLRLTAVSLDRTASPACAPVSTLRRISAPILALVGNADLRDRSGRLSAHVSYGIAADGVSRVTIAARDGRADAIVSGNAYLWVQNDPSTGARVSSITAAGPAGRLSTIRVSALDATDRPVSRPPRGPSRTTARITEPRIGWYERREPRGRSLRELVLTEEQRRHLPAAGFTRFVKPDPDSDIVMGLIGGRCVVVVAVLSFCNQQGFFGGTPPSPMTMTWFRSLANASDEFIGVAGAVADGVAEVTLYLADGQRQRAALKDNLFSALVQNRPPVRIVATNRLGQPVAIETHPSFGFAPAAPDATEGLRPIRTAVAPHGARGTILRGRAVDGTFCWRLDTTAGRGDTICTPVAVSGPRLWVRWVEPSGRDLFLVGEARRPVDRVELRLRTGETIATGRPTGGFFLIPIPSAYLTQDQQGAFAIGIDRNGVHVQRMRFYFRTR